MAGTMVEESVSLCSLRVGEEMFGLDTDKVQEVLGECEVQTVPLAPAFVGGVISYRGEVLVVVCLRRLLGMEPQDGPVGVVVLRDEQEGELFGVAVDSVSDVLRVKATDFEENPCTLDARSKMLFAGAYKLREALLVRLEPALLRPMRLMERPWNDTRGR